MTAYRAGMAADVNTVPVGGVRVADASQRAVIEMAARPACARARLVFALHVGGLLDLEQAPFRHALDAADVLYADGAAVVLLAKAGGARQIERAPTTDIGVPVLKELSRQLMRPARVAVVGGPDGLADRAGEALVQLTGVEIVYTHHGYFRTDSDVLDALRELQPDVVVLGLGMPKEALWAHQHQDDLPPTVVLTCGGWLGFLTGGERRAPAVLQRTGLEWTYRLAQHFPRLIGRYSAGALKVARLLPLSLIHI